MTGNSAAPPDAHALLDALANAVATAAMNGIAVGRFQPELTPVVRRTVTASSGTVHGSTFSHVDAQTWAGAVLKLVPEMLAMPEYATAKGCFGEGFDEAAQVLAFAAFDGLLTSKANRTFLYSQILCRLEDRAPELSLLADVIGLKPAPTPIVVRLTDGEFEVRVPRTSDLEWELWAWEAPSPLTVMDPDAVVEVRGVGRGPADAVRLVRTILAGIRLAAAGGCTCSSIRVVRPPPTFWSTPRRLGMDAPRPVGVAATNLGDVSVQRRLQAVFDSALPRLEPGAYLPRGKATTDVGIAFGRYVRAASGDILGEERIALAIMAMEALLLQDSTNLASTLAMRAARLLAATGLDADQVHADLKLAYDARSAFVHGSTLPKKTRSKILHKYSTVEDFVLNVLDLARRTILACLFGSGGKRQWIQSIDEIMRGSARATPLAGVFGLGLELASDASPGHGKN